MEQSNHGRQLFCAMSENHAKKSFKCILAPIELVSEVLFGLIRVLSFTGASSATQDGRAEIRPMVFGAMPCNLALGLIDGRLQVTKC